MPLNTKGVINKPLKSESLTVGTTMIQVTANLAGAAWQAMTSRVLIQNKNASGGDDIYVGIGASQPGDEDAITVEPREILPLNYQGEDLDKIWVEAAGAGSEVLIWQEAG
jgi:hypothetical protein